MVYFTSAFHIGKLALKNAMQYHHRIATTQLSNGWSFTKGFFPLHVVCRGICRGCPHFPPYRGTHQGRDSLSLSVFLNTWFLDDGTLCGSLSHLGLRYVDRRIRRPFSWSPSQQIQVPLLHAYFPLSDIPIDRSGFCLLGWPPPCVRSKISNLPSPLREIWLMLKRKQPFFDLARLFRIFSEHPLLHTYGHGGIWQHHAGIPRDHYGRASLIVVLAKG